MIPELTRLLRTAAYQLAIGLTLLCITLQYTGLSDLLAYQRSLIANGHWWLLLSGNFVHLGLNHLWMNMAGLALVVMLVWQHFNARQWLTLIFVCSWGVGMGLWLFNPEVEGYVGFSGTLHGLIIAGTIADLRSYPRSASILLFLVCGKLLWEQFAGSLPGSESVAGGQVLVDAHLYGAITGAVMVPLLLFQNRKKSNVSASK